MQLENENQGIMTEKAALELSALMFPENNKQIQKSGTVSFQYKLFLVLYFNWELHSISQNGKIHYLGNCTNHLFPLHAMGSGAFMFVKINSNSITSFKKQQLLGFQNYLSGAQPFVHDANSSCPEQTPDVSQLKEVKS